MTNGEKKKNLSASEPLKKNTLNPDRFKPRPVAALTFLRDLREECLNRSEKRMPKWKFRLAPVLVVQLQPKASYLPSKRQLEQGARIHQYQFEGLAVLVETGTATAEMFTKKPDRGVTAWCRRTFELFAYADDDWQLRLRGGTWSGNAWVIGEGWERLQELDECIFATFSGEFFSVLTPKALLGNYCLICGKGLTDPASMARRIGPECAGTSSLTVPFEVKS